MFLQFGDGQTDRRTDGHAHRMKPLRYRERWLNNIYEVLHDFT